MDDENINQKIEEKIKEIEQKAQDRIREKEAEYNTKLEQVITQLENCKSAHEIDSVMEKVGYSSSERMLSESRVKELFFKQLIDRYPLSKEIMADTKGNIVGISFAIFETCFNSLPYRLGLDKDDPLLVRTSKELLSRAEKEGDIDVMIPLKSFLNQDNTEEVRRKLDYLAWSDTNDKKSIHNSVNTIYYYELLLKWVANKDQQQEIKEIISRISKERIQYNIKEISDGEDRIRIAENEKQEANKFYPTAIKSLTEKNNAEISELEKQIKEPEEKIRLIDDQVAEVGDKIHSLGFDDFPWDERRDLEEGLTKEIIKKHENKKKEIKQIIRLLKEAEKLRKKREPYTTAITTLKGKIRELEYQIHNKEQEYNNLIQERDKTIEEIESQTGRDSNAILSAILKINEHGGNIGKSIDYYRYIEIVLDTATRDDSIDRVKKVLPLIGKKTN